VEVIVGFEKSCILKGFVVSKLCKLYLNNDKIKKNELRLTSSTDGRDEECI
jgi:hypothetical protein